MVQDAGGVFNTGRKENGPVGRKKRKWRSRREEGIYILEFLRFDSYPAFRLLLNTTWPSLHLAEPAGTSGVRSLETRFRTRGDDSPQYRAFFWHHIPSLALRPDASRSKLSSSQVDATMQPSNRTTNA